MLLCLEINTGYASGVCAQNVILFCSMHFTDPRMLIVHPVTGSIIFLGRADGVLNPSGVRFGSAEIYSVVERHFADRIQDSLCVGQRRPRDQDESVLLFLLMKPGHRYTRDLADEVREVIRKDLSKRHVPKYIFETKEIPVRRYPDTLTLDTWARVGLANWDGATPDDHQPEEGRASGEANRVGPHGQAEWDVGKPTKPRLLLSVCQCGRARWNKGEAVRGRWQGFDHHVAEKWVAASIHVVYEMGVRLLREV